MIYTYNPNEKDKKEDVNAVFKHWSKFQKTHKPASRSIGISNNIANKLAKEKTAIKSKDGVIQIGKDHPDYDFWMED